ncbi:MAG TPA: DUF1080 domain-containing protein [Bryobacteraceae bacterium]|nr:DUF1080 domain-containing protein [Bryobacteraceae bacterium]
MIVAAAAALTGFRIRAQQAGPGPAANAGWVSLFDGSTLDGWDGRSDVWKVEDGAITGEVAGGPSSVTDTTYIFWKGGEPSDFELKAEIKTEGAFVNSGIVYRGYVQPALPPGPGRAGAPPLGAADGGNPGSAGAAAGANGGQGAGGRGRGGGGRGPNNAPYKLAGPQLDFDGANRYAGQYYEIASDRGLLVHRGQIVEAGDHPEVIGSLGDDGAIRGYIKTGDWNQIRIVARGNMLIHVINGHVTSMLIDKDPARFRPKGLLAFQLEGAGKVRIRNIWLKAE